MIQTTLKTVDDQLAANYGRGTMSVTMMVFANTTASRRTVRLHHVGPAQDSSTANAILYDAAIAPYGSLAVDLRLGLGPGESLRGLADASGVSLTMYGTMQQ